MNNIFHQKVGLCSTPCVTAQFIEGGSLEYGEGCISFATEDGYFAALGHGVNKASINNGCFEFFTGHPDAPDTAQAGWAIRSMPAGTFGCFFGDYSPLIITSMSVAPHLQVKPGPAELWIADKSGTVHKYEGTLSVEDISSVRPFIFAAESSSPLPFSCLDGSVVVQDGKIAAVIAGAYAGGNQKFVCVAAEYMLVDLTRMMYEIKIASLDSQSRGI